MNINLWSNPGDTNNICCWFLLFLPMLLLNNFQEFLFCPVFHSVLLLFVVISHINVEWSFLSFTFDCQIVREFTFITFCTLSLFEECTENCFWISTCNKNVGNIIIIKKKQFSIKISNFSFTFCNFLSLHWFEQGSQLFLLLELLLLLKLLFVNTICSQWMMTSSLHLFLHLLYELLLLGTLLVLKTKCFVLQCKIYKFIGCYNGVWFHMVINVDVDKKLMI